MVVTGISYIDNPITFIMLLFAIGLLIILFGSLFIFLYKIAKFVFSIAMIPILIIFHIIYWPYRLIISTVMAVANFFSPNKRKVSPNNSGMSSD